MRVNCLQSWHGRLYCTKLKEITSQLFCRHEAWRNASQSYLALHQKIACLSVPAVSSHSTFSSQSAIEFHNVDEKDNGFVAPAETIVALSSGTGRSAVAVIRMSGPQSDSILESMLKRSAKLPLARTASVRSLHDPQTGDLLDTALILRFPGPASFTGEDIVEIQGHGGPAVVRSLLSAILGSSQARLAEAGEFTRRAFLAGKMDLTEVEGLADLLAAETAAQHRQALQQSSGKHRLQYEAWRKTLVTCLAHVEAVLDFGDDNDIESNVAGEIAPNVRALRRDLEHHLAEGRRGELLRNGFKVALVGAPNAGKSTVLNLLAGREAAIVSSTPGTTRDVVEVALEIAGHKVILSDTAGLRDTDDQIEAAGVSRAHQAASESDILIAISDSSHHSLDPGISALLQQRHEHSKDMETNSLTDRGRISQGWSNAMEPDSLEPQRGASPKPAILVLNKLDLAGLPPFQISEAETSQPEDSSRTDDHLGNPTNETCSAILHHAGATEGRQGTSRELLAELMRERSFASIVGMTAQSGEGAEALLSAIEALVLQTAGRTENSEGFLITRLRHRQHVEECISALKGYEEVQDQLELAAEELRFAAKALGRITGVIDSEEILSTVFAEFCIGK